MTYVLWNLLDDPRIPPTLKWGFRVANLALMGASFVSSVLPCPRLAPRPASYKSRQRSDISLPRVSGRLARATGLNVSWFRLMIISVLGRVKGKSTKDRVVKNGKNGQTTSARAKKSQ